MSKDFVLGVDLDAVVADYETRMRQITALVKGVPLDSIPPATVWSLVESGWPFESEEDFLATHRLAVEEYAMFRTLEPIEGVGEALWALSDAGVRIRIVTHRLVVNFSHAVAVADTVHWLDKHRLPFRDICFVKDKADVGCDLLVDDSPTNIMALRNARGMDSVLIFDQLYNRHLEGPRAHTWSDVVSHVSERSGITIDYPKKS